MWCNNKHILEGSSDGGKWVAAELWVMWMTKLRVTVTKTLHQTNDEHSQYNENMICNIPFFVS